MVKSKFNIVILRKIREEQPTLFPFLLEAIEEKDTKDTKDTKDSDFQTLLEICEQEEWYDWCVLIRDYKENFNEIPTLENENSKNKQNKQNIKKT